MAASVKHTTRNHHRGNTSPALRQRGSLTVWFTNAAIAAWKAELRTRRGGQPRYSALAFATALTLISVFRLALRQTEGLIASIIALLGLDLSVPDIQRSLAGPRAWTWFVFGLAPVPCTCWSKALG
jgi:hypothetical protein